MPKPASSKGGRTRKTRPKSARGSLKERAFGEAASHFGKVIAPLGGEAGALTLHVGKLLVGMVRNTVYGVENITSWLSDELARRLQFTPPGDIKAPDPRIAVPAVQALMYSAGEEHIQRMFANLLAADMAKATRGKAHPAFVQMIKEMTSLEARILEAVARRPQIAYRVKFVGAGRVNGSIEHTTLRLEGINRSDTRSAVSNLERLQLVEVRPSEFPTLQNNVDEQRIAYERLIREKYQKRLESFMEKPEYLDQLGLGEQPSVAVDKSGLFLTPLGRVFVDVCLYSFDDGKRGSKQ